MRRNYCPLFTLLFFSTIINLIPLQIFAFNQNLSTSFQYVVSNESIYNNSISTSTSCLHDNYSNDSVTPSFNEDSTQTRRKYFYEPYPLRPGVQIFQIGGSFSLLPLPIAEQEIPYPAIDVQYKRGLIKNLSWVGSLSTNIYTNLFHTGLQWNFNSERFSFGLADHFGFAYGFMKAEGLFENVDAYAFYNMPVMRFGYGFNDFSISLSFSFTYVFKSSSFINGMKASIGPENSINDFYFTLAVEQPFLQNTLLSIGFSLTYSRTPWQSWMLYNTLDEWLFVPEFFFAVQL